MVWKEPFFKRVPSIKRVPSKIYLILMAEMKQVPRLLSFSW